MIIHVKIDGYKFSHESPENIEHSPLLPVDIVKMQFSNNLVDVVKILQRKIFETRVLSSFAIDFQEYVLLVQFVDLDHIDEGVEFPLASLF